jgi:hypothetical protein
MLSRVLTLSQLKDRCLILQDYLRSTETVSAIDSEILVRLFLHQYTPDVGERKYIKEEIANIYIAKHPRYETKGFYLRLTSGLVEPMAYMRLAGKNRSEIENLTKALRSEIQPQIDAFRTTYPLDPTAFCPVAYCPLGTDAQCDHYFPTFRLLVKGWIAENPGPKVMYNKERCLYELLEPHKTSWIRYHLGHARLRWLSKVGNQKAHLL